MEDFKWNEWHSRKNCPFFEGYVKPVLDFGGSAVDSSIKKRWRMSTQTTRKLSICNNSEGRVTLNALYYTEGLEGEQKNCISETFA